jgi:hypothetical protein
VVRRPSRLQTVIGVLVIAGTFAVLWAIYQPTLDPTVDPKPPPKVPLLRDARAVVVMLPPGNGARPQRATIRCRGTLRQATGFWAGDPVEACDALAVTRAALLSGPGCRSLSARRFRLEVTGAFGSRRFAHRAQHLGCPDPEGWLAVDALGMPVLRPDQELRAAEQGGGQR